MATIPWNEENAAHLLRRAGFGGTAVEIADAVRDGLDATVEKLLNYESISTAELDARIARQNLDLTNFGGINRWWMTRLIYSPRPLEERMTLFWHDHFATGASKVNLAELMHRQNRLFRTYALGNFTEFTIEVSKDAAMLIWLDNFTNRKEAPNENYGRELLELFTLGQGFYSELDVFSASKAFTGWTLTRRPMFEFQFVPRWHDDTEKDFLGRVGNWNGDDIVKIACGEFAHGRLMASKLFGLFAWENAEPAVIDPFAEAYLDSGTDLKVLVEAILKSEAMYSPQALWSKVKSPIDHAVISCRQLLLDNDNIARSIQSALTIEGQTLYNPPDVAGWDGGLAWINSGALLSRMNRSNGLAGLVDLSRLTAGETVTTPEQLVDLLLRRLGPVPVDGAVREEMIRYVSPNGALPTGNNLVIKGRGLVHMILSLPEWQMY